MALVDSSAEHEVLEQVVEASKPPVPVGTADRGLHWLLYTPFRYRPPAGGSRFRGENDPGVFYGADTVRTACAEVGYWRWRHLRDTPALESMPSRPQSVFRAAVTGSTIDLRVPPFVRDRGVWTQRSDYSSCQDLGRIARAAGAQVIRYESVRDSRGGVCGVVLDAAAFASRAPVEFHGWMLTVTRSRVTWQRIDPMNPGVLEFAASNWE